MLHLIGKNLWARRYRNGWLLAELIIVSMVIWVLTDPIVVTTHDRGLPTGITEEGMYRLNLAAVSSKSARFEAGEDTPEARAWLLESLEKYCKTGSKLWTSGKILFRH